MDKQEPEAKYLVVNADESEPGAFKDRELMGHAPHRLIEGCLIVAHAIESTQVYIYIRGEYLAEYEILARAVDEARRAGSSATSRSSCTAAPARTSAARRRRCSVPGGKRGQPRPRPPFPPIQGLYGAPTQINNVGTIATVPKVLELGVEEFKQVGVDTAPGTAVSHSRETSPGRATTSSSWAPSRS